MLFSELAKQYLEDNLPKWGAREVSSISYEDVQEWVDRFTACWSEEVRRIDTESGAEGTARGDVCDVGVSLGFRVHHGEY